MRGAKANSEIKRLIILVNTLLLLSPITGSAYADDRCSETATIVTAIDTAADQLHEKYLNDLRERKDPTNSENQIDKNNEDLFNAVGKGQRDPKNLTLACVLLEQRRPTVKRTSNPWTPFPDEHIKSDKALFDACYQAPGCRSEKGIQRLLERVCTPPQNGSPGGGDSMDPKACAAIKPPTAETARPELSKVRKRVGLGLIIGGGAVVLLGALHMSFPLFSKADGCVVYGLAHPCSADRWGTGGGLLGGGLLTVGGGILTLVLP
jgi:hypothetical protein